MAFEGAIMVPHPPIIIGQIGRGEEKKIQSTIDAYRSAARFLLSKRPQLIVISSPHTTMYSDYFHISPGLEAEGDFSAYRAKEVQIKVTYDQEFVNDLSDRAEMCGIPAGTLGERDRRLDHGTMIPLVFVQEAYRQAGVKIDYKIARVGLSGLPLIEHYRLGMLIAKSADALERRSFFIASGDLSHKLKEDGPYGLSDEGPIYDEKIMDTMGRAAFGELFDFDETFCEKAAECGHKSFVIMAGALDGRALVAKRLSHEGTFGVGYGVCTYDIIGESEERHFAADYEKKRRDKMSELRQSEDTYVRLARRAVEGYVKNASYLSEDEVIGVIEGDSEAFGELTTKRGGTFVSLHKDGQLRGCIGTTGPTQKNIALETASNAVSACSRDPRFSPVSADEVDNIVYSVDILSEPEHIDSPDELDVKHYGVIVKSGSRRGLLLPNLDGVDSVDEQLSIARRKAGIGDMEKVSLERFEVVRHF